MQTIFQPQLWGAHFPATIFEISIVFNYLSASEKLTIMAHLNVQWKRFVFSGYAWRDFVNQPDPTWNPGILYSDSASLLKRFSHFKGMCSLPIDLLKFGPELFGLDVSEAESVLLNLSFSEPAGPALAQLQELLEHNPHLLDKVARLVLCPKIDDAYEKLSDDSAIFFKRALGILAESKNTKELKLSLPTNQLAENLLSERAQLMELRRLEISLVSTFPARLLNLSELIKLDKLILKFEQYSNSEAKEYNLPLDKLPLNLKELELDNFVLDLDQLKAFKQLKVLTLLETVPHHEKPYEINLETLESLRVEIETPCDFKISIVAPRLWKCGFAFFQKHNLPYQFQIKADGVIQSSSIKVKQQQERPQLFVEDFDKLAQNMSYFHSHRFCIRDSMSLHRDYTLIQRHTLTSLKMLRLESYSLDDLAKLHILLPNLNDLILDQQSQSAAALVTLAHPQLQSFQLRTVLPKVEVNISFSEDCVKLRKVELYDVKAFSCCELLVARLDSLRFNTELRLKVKGEVVGELGLEESAWKSQNLVNLARISGKIELNQQAVQVFEEEGIFPNTKGLTLLSSTKRRGSSKSKFFRQASKSSNLLYHLELLQDGFVGLLVLRVHVDLMASFTEEVPLCHKLLRKVQFFAQKGAQGNKIRKVLIREECISLEIFELKRVELEQLQNQVKQPIAFRGTEGTHFLPPPSSI